MREKLICTKVISLLSLFIDGKLSKAQQEFVVEHLKSCYTCREKYENLKNLLNNLKASYIDEIVHHENKFVKKEFDYYKENLSAYFDNELPFEESVRFKKYIMKLPLAREELQKIYELKKMIHKNLENSQKKMNTDFSKVIVRKIYAKQKMEKIINWTKTAALIFVFLICATLASVIYYAKQTNLLENFEDVALTPQVLITFSISKNPDATSPKTVLIQVAQSTY